MVCPVCRASEYRKINDHPVEQHLHLEILPRTIDVLECMGCGLFYKSPLPSDAVLKTYYSNISEKFWNHSEVYPHERQLSSLMESMASGSRILDVGCGTGILLSKFASKHKCFGIEANRKAADVAESRGITIIDEWITSKINSVEPFDLIIAVDLFEHLADPFNVINLLYQRLSVGGKMVVVTGRTDCLPVWWLGADYWYLKLAQHIVFLNRKHINWLGGRLHNCRVSFRAIHHYDVEWSTIFRYIRYSILWGMFSSWSRRRIFKLKKYDHQLPFYIIRSLPDHYFVELQKMN